MPMAVATKDMLAERENVGIRKSMPRMADAHCHIESMATADILSSIERGVDIIIANGVDTASNLKTLAMCDGKNTFAALGVHPEHAISMDDKELEKNIKLVMDNRTRVVAIGEVGIDMRFAASPEALARQEAVFSRFVDLAMELNVPVCIHSRNALDRVFRILDGKHARLVQLHFFEGDEDQAKVAEGRGYMISVPPMDSGKRKRAIRAVSMANLLAETDSPVNGATPRDVEKSIRIIAAAKGVPFEEAAEVLTQNTRRFFNIGVGRLMR